MKKLFNRLCDKLFDNDIYKPYSNEDYHNDIVKKIKNNKNLSYKEKRFIWDNYSELYTPKTKGDLIYIFTKYYKENVTNFNFIDVSHITDMSMLFSSSFELFTLGKINISEWDVSNVTDMNMMFCNCENFNADLSKWDVSNVKNMSKMFFGCKSFTSCLDSWNVSNVTDMCYMFYKCDKFKSDLSKWNASKVIEKI